MPNPGDFKRTVVGERSVILSRAADGARRQHCVENVCAHRGMQFCRKRHGSGMKEFVCPYHQWSYTLSGDLQGVRRCGAACGRTARSKAACRPTSIP